MTNISSNSNCDLNPIVLEHKFIQDFAILNICMNLYQNQFKNSAGTQIYPRFRHTQHLYEFISKSVHK